MEPIRIRELITRAMVLIGVIFLYQSLGSRIDDLKDDVQAISVQIDWHLEGHPSTK